MQSNSKNQSKFSPVESNTTDKYAELIPKIINLDGKVKLNQNTAFDKEIHEDSEDTMTYDNYNILTKSHAKSLESNPNSFSSKAQLESKMK